MREIFFIIQKHRLTFSAPVDTMGCTCIPETDDQEERKFRILMMLMLSPQTKDQITYETVKNLNSVLTDKFGEGITKCNIARLEISFLESQIKKINFHKTKAKNIQKIAMEFSQKDLPNEHKQLVKLPGIGNKIAFLYLQHACDKILGVSVDTHVHRIINRIGYFNTKNPEQTRKELENIFEKEHWISLNKTLVGYGQTICTPKKPKCNECKVTKHCKYFKSLDF